MERSHVLARHLLTLLLLLLGMSVSAQPRPAFVYEDILDADFYGESALIAFTEFDLAFAPEEPLNAAIAVVDEGGTVLESFAFRPEYRYREGVFAKARVVGPADITLPGPGVYNIVFLVNGEMATRLPLRLEQVSDGSDPFDPVKTYRFDGLWRAYAHFTENTFKDEPFYELTFWVGGKDLAEGAKKDNFFVELFRDGERIGHSKRTQGFISNQPFERVKAMIYEPHEPGREANAELLFEGDFTADGSYVAQVTRQSDGAVIRRFAYTAQDGAVVPLANTELGYEPRVDYIVPRVTKKGSNRYEFVEAIWIKSEGG